MLFVLMQHYRRCRRSGKQARFTAKLHKTSPFIGILSCLWLSAATVGGSAAALQSGQGAEAAAPDKAAAAKPIKQKAAHRPRAAAADKQAANGAKPPYSKIGGASWYGAAFQGKHTANGEIFNMHHLTAAHRTMPLPSYARITNLQNGSSLIVRVNDRGPYTHNRVIDLSQQAAQLLGYSGLAKVKVDYVGPAPLKADDDRYLRASYRPSAKRAAAADLAKNGALSRLKSGK